MTQVGYNALWNSARIAWFKYLNLKLLKNYQSREFHQLHVTFFTSFDWDKFDPVLVLYFKHAKRVPTTRVGL